MSRRRLTLPRDRGWAVRAEDFLDRLRVAGAPELSGYTRFQPYMPDGTVIGIDWDPNSRWWRTGWGAGPERVTLSIHDVPVTERAEVERQVIDTVLPDLAQWLKDAADAADGWRLLPHHRSWA